MEAKKTHVKRCTHREGSPPAAHEPLVAPTETPLQRKTTPRPPAPAAARSAAFSALNKVTRKPHPPISTASLSPTKSKRKTSTAPKKLRRTKPHPPATSAEQQPSPVFSFAADVQNRSRYIEPCYDAWVSTTPAAVMKRAGKVDEKLRVKALAGWLGNAPQLRC